MRKILLIAFLMINAFVNAQAYKGKGDKKIQIGALIQDGVS